MVNKKTSPKSKFKKIKIFTLVVAILSTLIGKKSYDLAAEPKEEKDCDYVYPNTEGKVIIKIPSAELKRLGLDIKQVGGYVNDASCLNKTSVFAVAEIRDEDDVRDALGFAIDNDIKITPSGQKHSMGGQSNSEGGLILDMRKFDEVKVDVENKIVNVQSGATWRHVQEILDKEDLAVKAMQSINLFTVGGTLSVNAHGVAHNPGQIAPTVRSMRVMLSSGEIVKTSKTERPELFSAVLGGYGLSAIILDVDLDIVDNETYEWGTEYIDYEDFSSYYDDNILGNKDIGLMYARLSISPTSYLKEIAVHTYNKIDYDVQPKPLSDGTQIWLKRFIFNFSKTGDLGRWFRWTTEKKFIPGYHKCITRNNIMKGTDEEVCVATRNQKMNQSMEYLAVKQKDTNILHEYFIPQENTTEFIDGLRRIVKDTDVNLLNVTLRIVTKDSITALPYAKDDRIAFVLYFNQKLNDKDSEKLRKATIDLIDLSIENGGTYYLPYQLHYSKDQLRQAYPEIDRFFNLKRKYDPTGLLTNSFYEKYGKN